MIYVAFISGYSKDHNVREFATKAQALEFVQTLPRKSIVGVFDGKRLVARMGERRIVKTDVVDLEVAEPEQTEEPE